MFGKLFILFALMPILEIALLINVGDAIGGWNTVAIVILTAIVGAHLVRKEGLHTLFTAQTKLNQGELPGQQMAEGLLLVIAGVLLVTPGFITDIIGFTLAMPLTRPAIARSLMKQIKVRSVSSSGFQSQFHTQHTYQSHQDFQQHSQGGQTFEGEFENSDEVNNRPKIERD